MIHVLIVDDHPTFRSGLRAVLTAQPDIEVVGEASSGDEALEVLPASAPDVVLMDLVMPGMGGVEATERITAAGGARVVVLTMSESDASVVASLRAGAAGYLLKDAPATDIVAAVRAAAAGNAILGERVASRVRAFFSGSALGGVRPFPELTERQREVLELVAEGRSNSEIARRLSLSEKTVRNYVSSVLTTLGTSTRAEAIARARDAGLGSRD